MENITNSTTTNNDQQTATFDLIENAGQTLQQELDALAWKIDSSARDDVKEFLLEYYPGGLVYLHNTFLAYKSGYWVAQLDHHDVQTKITKYFGPSAKVPDVREMFQMLRLTCSVKGEEFRPDTNYVCFENGALDMTTFELVPHSPHFHLRSGRPAVWDENAKSPVFEKFLHDIFRDDKDRDQKMQFVLEWMGLCLVPDTSFEKFVVCVGEGGNGKSVLLKLMSELLGHENVYSAPIQRLGNRRALAELDGKLLLTSSEINENTVMDDGILKQIVSGDTVEAERKYEHPFTYTPVARIMLATNHLPKLRDVTHAFFRRLVMLRFNRNFTTDEMDMNLPAKLKAELSGIFTMAVTGLRSLRKRGQFVEPASSTEASDEYRKNSDVVKLFAEEALNPTADKGMRPAALYELYLKWCKSHGAKAENNINLGKQLKRLGFNKARSNGKDYWCVNVTLAGKEILSKPSARVEEIVPDVAEAANSAELLMDRDEKAEERIAA
jgi:putative DNA primase/helicase